MGIVSKCVRCLSCGEAYRLRYNIGNKYPQSSTFPCDKCGEDLTFGVDESERGYIKENLEIIEADMKLKVVNLHPELTINPEQINDPLYFPSVLSLVKHNAEGQEGIFGFQSAQLSCIQYQQHWDEVQKDFRYLKEKRWSLLKAEFGTDHAKVELEIICRVIFTIDFFLVGSWKKHFAGIGKELRQTLGHPNFTAFKDFVTGWKDDIFFNKMFQVMTTYRKIESILLPTLLDQKCGITPSGISSKIDWEQIKHFYGQIYEIYGDMLAIPSAMNNLVTRGNFKTFSTAGFTIEKYLETDKAGRTSNFMQNKNFQFLGQYYVASIRNGTHHEASTFDKNDQIITLRTGKGGKTLKTIPLVEYIVHCNELYARLLIVFRMCSTLIYS